VGTDLLHLTADGLAQLPGVRGTLGRAGIRASRGLEAEEFEHSNESYLPLTTKCSDYRATPAALWPGLLDGPTCC